MINKLNFLFLILLSSCAANSIRKEAVSVKVVYQKPEDKSCVLIGEVSGAQGNKLTGFITSSVKLMVGAQNTIKNNTYKLGGNVLHIHDVSNDPFYTAITGRAYSCEKKPLTESQMLSLKKANLRSELVKNIDECMLGDADNCWGATWRSVALKKNTNAIKYFELALKAGWNNWSHLDSDKDINSLRELKQFKELLVKYRK